MFLWANNATSTLRQDTAAASISLTVQSGEGARFPSPTPQDICMVTIEDRRTGQLEICRMTSRVADVLQVTRAQENTAALDFASGATVSNRLTAGTLQMMQNNSSFMYLGAWPVHPTPDAVGPLGQICPNPIPPGMQYFNTTDGFLYTWTGTAWTNQASYLLRDGSLPMLGSLRIGSHSIIAMPVAAGDTILDAAGGAAINLIVDGGTF